ncbi:DUF1178 family protein [Sphingomonas baiyangensis]|uniref:DUF1178 family protein n=1 Tax=Sphingomonas baiyangensis TaxID=2572576 RepID=A0A4U1L2E2_9SPHN|nr:DUF1178 family protein [Sphingomonas baiyangensis]TKD50380.1 DUF1178 family protein [Sphingomonas baiyangensis]
MIVFDLRCTHGHVFEAWFASSVAFDEQRGAGLIACPVCGDAAIEKAVMAPNVAPKSNRAAAAPPPAMPGAPPPEAIKAALRAIADAQAKALETSTWVGTAFVDQARAMHLGDVEQAPIHGEATREQARALAEEGVPVAPLLIPVVPPRARN